MPKNWIIQWKAFLMLVVFTVNFCVVCHCAANAAPKAMAMHCHGCCEKQSGKSGDKDGKDCQGMQAVRFNLLEKQTADPVTSGELPVLFISTYTFNIPVVVLSDGAYRLPEQWAYKHSPPDLQVLHQLFLI